MSSSEHGFAKYSEELHTQGIPIRSMSNRDRVECHQQLADLAEKGR